MGVQKHIQQFMDERGWSKYRLSKNSSLSQTAATNVLKRDSAPTLPALEVICDTFGITLAQFFSDGSEPIELTEQQKELFREWGALGETQGGVLLDLMSHM